MTRSTSVNLSTPPTQLQKLDEGFLLECSVLIQEYQKELRIQDWDIEISQWKPVAKDSLFEISMNRLRKHAAIRISDKALTLSRKKFNRGILHELVHIIFDEMDYEIKMGKHFAYNRTFDRYLEARERTVDHLSKVLYSALS